MLFLMYTKVLRSTTKAFELWWSGVMTSRQIGERKLLCRGHFHVEIVLYLANQELVNGNLWLEIFLLIDAIDRRTKQSITTNYVITGTDGWTDILCMVKCKTT